MRRFALAAIVLVTAAGGLRPAAAQDGPVGIAFAQAPEQSFGYCVAGSPDAGLACARQKCVDGGAAASDCLRVAWCYPSGWSVDVFLQHREGPHWHEYSCGWASRELALKAAELKCDRTLNPHLIDCTAVQLWDPAGAGVPLE
jgi:hypothetical protein